MSSSDISCVTESDHDAPSMMLLRACWRRVRRWSRSSAHAADRRVRSASPRSIRNHDTHDQPTLHILERRFRLYCAAQARRLPCISRGPCLSSRGRAGEERALAQTGPDRNPSALVLGPAAHPDAFSDPHALALGRLRTARPLGPHPSSCFIHAWPAAPSQD